MVRTDSESVMSATKTSPPSVMELPYESRARILGGALRVQCLGSRVECLG